MSISSVGSNINRNAKAIEVYRGQSKTITINLLDANKEPFNTENLRMVLTIRKSIDDPQVIIKKDSVVSANQIEFPTPFSTGVAKIYFDSSDTAYQEPGEYVFDLWAEEAQNAPAEDLRYPVIEVSQFIIKKPVTSF